MWFKVSIATVAAVVLPFTAYMYVVESSHEHHEKKLYPHMKVRRAGVAAEGPGLLVRLEPAACVRR